MTGLNGRLTEVAAEPAKAEATPLWFRWAYAGAAAGLMLALPTLILSAFVFAGLACGAAFQAFKLAAGLH